MYAVLCADDRWAYIRKNNVELPDEYDQIVRFIFVS